jgi:uncharacterized protein (TIGR02186 family)
MKRSVTIMLAAAALAGLLGPVRAERLISSLSSHQVLVTSSFAGAELVLFGSIERDRATVPRRSGYSIVVTVIGPRQTLVTRRKDRVFGIWTNAQSRTFVKVPSYLAVLSNQPLDEIASLGVQQRLDLGFDNVPPPQTAALQPTDLLFREALIRLKKERGLYLEEPKSVTFLTPNLFRTGIRLPAEAPVGTYEVGSGGGQGRRRTIRREQRPRSRLSLRTRDRPDGVADRMVRFRRFPARLDGSAIGKATNRRQGVKPLRTEHVHGIIRLAEDRRDGAVANVEPAGKGTKRRQDHTQTAGNKAFPADHSTARQHPRHRVQMAGNLRHAVQRVRLVPERHRADRSVVLKDAADSGGRVRIMVAGDPDPLASALKRAQTASVIVAETGRAGSIVKAVAKTNHLFRLITCDDLAEPRERRTGVVRRQKLSGSRKARSLLQMQVSDAEEPCVRPVQCPRQVRAQCGAGNFNDLSGQMRLSNGRRSPHPWPPLPIRPPPRPIAHRKPRHGQPHAQFPA